LILEVEEKINSKTEKSRILEYRIFYCTIYRISSPFSEYSRRRVQKALQLNKVAGFVPCGWYFSFLF